MFSWISDNETQWSEIISEEGFSISMPVREEYCTMNETQVKLIFKRYFTSLFEQVVQPPRYELFYTLTNCKRSCLSSHLHRCKKRISPILCFWNCSISRIPSFLQTFYLDSIHVDFDMKWCSKSIHEIALLQIQL